MAHVLKGKVAIDVDNDIHTGWPGGLEKIGKVKDPAITCLLFDPRVVTLADVKAALTLGFLVGIRYDPAWDKDSAGNYPKPEVAAKRASDYVAKCEADGVKRVSFVEYDVETHDRVWQIKFLLGYKVGTTILKGVRGAGGQFPDPAKPETLGYRWGRPFVYTFEPGQSTATCAADVAQLAGGLVGPQLYDKNMKRRDMRWELKTWVEEALVPFERMWFYYGANDRPSWIFEGCLFATTLLPELYV